MSDTARELSKELIAMTNQYNELLKACQDMMAASVVDKILAERELATMTKSRQEFIECYEMRNRHELLPSDSCGCPVCNVHRKLAIMTAAKNKAVEALKVEHGALEMVKAGVQSTPKCHSGCPVCQLISELEKVKE